jgi:putative hydrolase of the HAD superfamily
MSGDPVVLLDVGGVLLLPDHRLVGLALSPFGVSVSAADTSRAHYAGVAAIDREPPATKAKYLPAFAVAIGVSRKDLQPAVIELERLSARPSVELWSQRIEGASEGLRSLARAGHRVGVISNSDGTVEEQLRLRGLCQVGPGPGVEVEVIADSSHVGYSKPDPEIFRWTLEAMRAAPARAVFVGDCVTTDVRGAQALGIEAIHFDPQQGCTLSDHRHVGSLTEVRLLIEQS